MIRWTSEPLSLAAAGVGAEFARADLVFEDVDHSGPSFEARVFLGNPRADEDTPLETESGYAGSFHVFGHGGCFGDVGHCDVPAGPAHPFDRRAPHPLTPQRKVVIVTEALRHLLRADGAPEEVEVTVVVLLARSPNSREDEDPLRFERVTLATYE